MKFYTFLKAFGEHAKGAEVELNDADPVTKQYVDLGIVAESKSQAATDTEAFADEFVGKLFAKMNTAVEKSKGPRIDAGDSELDRQKSFGHWLQVVGVLGNPEATHQHQKAAETLGNLYKSKMNNWADKPVIKAANIEGSGPAGGYTVPPEYSTEIWRIAVEDTILANKARRRPMTSNEFRYPKLDQTGTQATGQSGYLGGVVARWSKETAARTETEPKLKQGVMKAGELTGYSIISNELLQDNAAGLAALITELFAEANSYYLDYSTLVGDGVDKPLGVLNAPATITSGPNAGGRTTASTVVYADLTYLAGLLLPKSMSTAFWVFNQTVKTTLFNLKDGSNRNIWLPNFPGGNTGPVSGAGGGRILDLPYYFTEKTPVLGTAGDVMLIDPMGYMIGDRMSLEIAASPHVNFLNNEMTYRFVSRMAGQPMLDKAFTMIDGTNKLSHFVALN